MEHTIPDGIILDLMMPNVDGFEVLDILRSKTPTSTIPVLILTAKTLTKDDIQSLAANNVQQLVQKGDIDQENLLLKIRLMLGKARITEQNTDRMQFESPTNLEEFKFDDFLGDSGRKKRILIIEDNFDNIETLKAILGKHFELLIATDGEEGLSKAVSEDLDLILLDIALPKKDGFEVLAGIKKEKTNKKTPIIVLTASAMRGDRERILAAGCDDYLSKPIELSELHKAFRKWIK